MLFNEPKLLKSSAPRAARCPHRVSVLFNEPKLLKCEAVALVEVWQRGFSALQRAEIAEILVACFREVVFRKFQCSSTSRNC